LSYLVLLFSFLFIFLLFPNAAGGRRGGQLRQQTDVISFQGDVLFCVSHGNNCVYCLSSLLASFSPVIFNLVGGDYRRDKEEDDVLGSMGGGSTQKEKGKN
jgi:hypothetical protein